MASEVHELQQSTSRNLVPQQESIKWLLQNLVLEEQSIESSATTIDRMTGASATTIDRMAESSATTIDRMAGSSATTIDRTATKIDRMAGSSATTINHPCLFLKIYDDFRRTTAEAAAGANKSLLLKRANCPHPMHVKGVCQSCGLNLDRYHYADGYRYPYIALGYIRAQISLRRMAWLRWLEHNNLLHKKRLCLVLDLDQTLLHSAGKRKLTRWEKYLWVQTTTGDPQDGRRRVLRHLFSAYPETLTKLRPDVHRFLEEAHKMYELYVYTMGTRDYAEKMVQLLDPKKEYFESKVISREDRTKPDRRKGLDVVIPPQSLVVILDDTETVWRDHTENLIVAPKYCYFANKGRTPSFAETGFDEGGAVLMSLLHKLKRVHQMFFDEMDRDSVDPLTRDVRDTLKIVMEQKG